MSDFPQGADWWKAADGRWFPPDSPKPDTPPGEDPPPPPDGGLSTAAGQPKSSDDNSAKVGCGVLIAFVVVVSVLLSMCGGGDEDEGGADDLQFGAFDVCTQFVEDRLRAPSTASFRNFYEDDGEVTVTGFGDGPYTVRSSVDSQNGFGATIRTEFVCEVRHTGGGNWRMIDVQLIE